MEFSPSPEPTVGIEWELQLLDSETLDLSNGIVPLMEFFPDTRFVKPELIQSSVEINSCIGDNSAKAVANVQETLCQRLDLPIECLKLQPVVATARRGGRVPQ